MSEPKTRKRTITITDAQLATYCETGNENPSPFALLLRGMDAAEAKKIIQRSERAVETGSKDKLEKDKDYQTAKTGYESAKNTLYRTRAKLNVVDVSVPNPDFNSEQPVSEENPETVIIQRNGFQTKIEGLREKIREEEKAWETAEEQTADGTNPKFPEGKLHENMRKTRERKDALARKALGLNGTSTPTPAEALTDGGK